MCGLVAWFGEHHNRRAAAAIGRIQYRGTRSPTAVRGNGWTLAHVRLPIVGVDHPDARQPYDDGGLVLAFVGELLDWQEREDTADLPCDLSAVARLWKARGARGLNDRDGFWAVAAVDRHTSTATFLTDYLAQKPLYIRLDELGRVVAVASEPVALLDPDLPTTPDEVYLSAAVKWGYCPEVARTPWNEIRRLPPGHALTVHTGLAPRDKGGAVVALDHVDRVRPVRYGTERVSHLRVALSEAAQRRALSSDVPVSALVSGGLDSTAAYLMAGYCKQRIKVYHVDNPGDDAGTVAQLARYRGDPFERVDLSTGGPVPCRTLLDYMQEPLDLGSLEPQVKLSANIYHNVCITGDGADELFGGYGRTRRYDSQASDIWQELVAWHLPRLDRVMMRHCIEVRSPYLARRVLEIALGLSYEDRIDKNLLRAALRPVVGDAVADAEKVPLRTGRVSSDREGRSKELVELFRRSTKWTN